MAKLGETRVYNLKLCPPRASGAGGGRPVNLLILLKPPQTAQLCGYRAQLAAISDLPRHTSQRVRAETVSGALHGLAETNEPSHAGANSGRLTPTASDSSARRRCYRREDPDGRRTVAGYKRRPCTDGCRQRTVQFQQSAGRGSAQRRQGERESSGSQSVDQGEHPVPNVEEEQAAAATLRRWHGQ